MFKIIIPTYKRVETLKRKTMAMLQRTDISMGDVIIFVADDTELQEYLKAFPDMHIVVGKRGIPNQRNFIQDYFNEGDYLVMIDDDIESIQYLKEKKLHELKRLSAFIENAFFLTSSYDCMMWGLNSSPNPRVMTRTFSTGLIYLVGNFIGLINTHNKDVYVDEGKEIPARKQFKAGKESHERAIKHYLTYGGVLKFRGISVKSEYWKGDGGHQVSRTIEGEEDATAYLEKKYPNYCKRRLMNGIPDIVIRTKTKTYPYLYQEQI